MTSPTSARLGKRGVGYAVAALRQRLAAILGIDRGWRIGLVGVGNLGRALVAYPGFNNQGFDVVAAFDSDASVIGSRVNGQFVRPVAALENAVRDEQIDMVIVTVPAACGAAGRRPGRRRRRTRHFEFCPNPASGSFARTTVQRGSGG